MKKLNLSGIWNVLLDPEKKETLPVRFPQQITLPGTTSAAGLGPENPARETGFLTDAHRFEGCAWFCRSFDAEGFRGRRALLTLERTRLTRVWLDGQPVSPLTPEDESSLCTPHRYLLPPLSGGTHTLLIRVDNTGYPTKGGHLTSPDTQSNWNGITGEISLTAADCILTGLRLLADPERKTLRVRADVLGSCSCARVFLPGQEPQVLPVRGGLLDGVCRLTGDEALWDEFSPSLHPVALELGEDRYEASFGLRTFRRDHRRLLCNGREVFLRGRNDALIFPLTGYAPTDRESWLRVFRTAADYGFNFFRYHTCCPPEAAFEAADELGFVLSPELPFWGTVAEEGEEGYNAAERHFLVQEGFRMLREFGRHPSFAFLSMGNELWGSKAVLNQMMRDYRAYDPDKLYLSGSNNFQFAPDVLEEEDLFSGVRLGRDRLFRGSYAMCDAPQGIVQTTAPESVSTYDEAIVPPEASSSGSRAETVLIQYGTGVREVRAESAEVLVPDVPLIAHETGQYTFYPDFGEIPRYTGPLKPRALEVFRERLQAAGLWEDHDRFFLSAGKLAVACYRREIETHLRTRELAGFQLLDLQDFPGQGTALVGVLNSLLESKGLITPEEWRRFCASTVVLGLLDRFVFAQDEELRFSVQVSECDPRKAHTSVTCRLLSEGRVLRETSVSVPPARGRLSEPVSVSLGVLSAGADPRQTLALLLEDGTCNEYPLWVFPVYPELSVTRQGLAMGSRRLAFVSSAEEAASAGIPAVVIPDSAGKLPAEYASDFWCYAMFRAISESMGKPVPVGTMGLCIRSGHPWLRHFTREAWTVPAWYSILRTAHCESISCPDPVVQMIDNTERCQRLGILWQQNGLPHLTARLWENPEDPAVRAFAYSLLTALGQG